MLSISKSASFVDKPDLNPNCLFEKIDIYLRNLLF
jgi:hypothetical protein